MAQWATQAAVREYQLASNGELTVVERLASLLETGKYADVTIRVGDGDDVVTFKAHRLLLATASQPLNNLVATNIKNGPGQVATLRVTDIEPNAFQHILKYIYTDNVQIKGAGESITLLRAGRKWGLQNLANKTLKFLDDFLNEYEPNSEEQKNELCDLAVLSDELGLDMKSKCWNVFLKNVNQVVPCQSFLNMPKHMIKYLLTHTDFHFKDQLVLFEAIRDWGMNQVLQQNLSVNSLQGLIGEFLQLIDFKSIKDNDFLDTILPSECLGKAELIAFFLARGLEIPRDLVYNNSQERDANYPYEKSGRYKRGYKLPNQEIYKEHEIRFRVDKKLRLLGVGFGFLFSNTDMGITVHCKGPWETRQWGDIMQTYCRVSYEKMKTADVRLMFSEPVIIEANHSYKILVRVSRMSTGSSDVDLWGGTQGVSRLQIKGAEISFLKAAVDSDKTVMDSDTENKPGMITDLIYELFSESTPTKPGSSSVAPSRLQNQMKPAGHSVQMTSVVEKKNLDESSTFHSNDVDFQPTVKSPVNTVADPNSQMGSTSDSSYSFHRNVPSSRVEISPPASPPANTRLKKTFADEAASYFLPTKPSSIRGSDAVPTFLQSRDKSIERSKPSWQIPSRTRSSAAVFNSFRREPSANREASSTKDTSYTPRRPSKQLDLFDNSTLSKYGYGVSNFKSKFESTLSSDTTPLKREHDSPSRTQQSSRYGSTLGSSSLSRNESRYGSTLQPSSYSSSISDSRYGGANSSSVSGSNATEQTGSRYTSNTADSLYNRPSASRTSTSDGLASSRYTSGISNTTSSSRPGREPTPSPSRFGASSSSYKYGTGRETGLNKSSSGTIPSLGHSRYSSSGTSSSTGTGSRYGSSTLSSSAASSTPGSSNRYGSSTLSSSAASSTPGSSNKYGSSTLSSSAASSTPGSSNRYGSSTLSSSAASSTPGSTNRYGSSTLSSSAASSTPGSSNRYGSSTLSSSAASSTPGSTTRYGSSALSSSAASSTPGSSNRYGSSALSSSAASSTPGSSNRYGSNISSTGTSSNLSGSSKRYESSTSGSTGTSSSIGSNRYGLSSSSTNNTSSSGTSSSTGTRLGSSYSTPSSLSSNRYGTSSSFGSTYNNSISNRFGNSIYRR